jgi:hypothetical protein
MAVAGGCEVAFIPLGEALWMPGLAATEEQVPEPKFVVCADPDVAGCANL